MSQNNKIWEINGLSLELDLADADVVERYENAFEEMHAAIKEIPKDGKKSEKIRAECKVFYRFFELVFDTETADKIFKDTPASVPAYIAVYDSFLDFAVSQGKANQDYLASRLTKYTPNRQQRRTQQRHSKKK